MTNTIRRALKVVGVLVLIALAIFAGGMVFMSRGLSQVENLTINEVDLSKIDDGVYTGEYRGYRWSNSVEVVVQDHTIKEIRPIRKQMFHMDEPINELIARIKERQEVDVDVVSGATVSSKAFLKAVENALMPK